LECVLSVKVKHPHFICLVQIMCHDHEVVRVALLCELELDVKGTNFLMPLVLTLRSMPAPALRQEVSITSGPRAVSRSIVFIEPSVRSVDVAYRSNISCSVGISIWVSRLPAALVRPLRRAPKGELACRDPPVPGQQLMLIHVSRKPVDCVNRAASPERIAKGRTKP
jgi:hypothetical protein